MSDTVQQIKDRLSIVDVVGQYVKLQRSGASLKARCPFHAERTPSFHVSPDRGTYHCFGCNVGGDIFSFVEAIEGLDFKGALKVLAERAGVELKYERGGKELKDERDRLFELMEAATIYYAGRLTDEAKKYLKDRGMTEATINEFRLGWAGNKWEELSDFLKSKKFTDKEIVDSGMAKKGDRGLTDKFRNRILFPIADSAGRVVAFSGRIFGEDASPEAPKYLNSPETPLFHKSRILYGFDRAKVSIRKLGCAVLVEGQMDLVASHQAGWGNTVAVSGTAFTPEHATLIRRMTDNLVIGLDADEAGIKAASRAAREALRAGLNVKVAPIPEGMDPADLILKKGPEEWKKTIKNSKDIITFLLDVLENPSTSSGQGTPDPHRYRRIVEVAVLPFLHDVQSPIAREQYIQEIAKRLRVSEAAVTSAFANVPKAPETSAPSAAPVAKKPLKSSRAQKAYELLLWQESLDKPGLNVKTFAKELEGAMAEEHWHELRAIPEEIKERMRYSAEREYAQSRSLESDARSHIGQILKHERLPEVAAALSRAEREGDKKALAALEKEREVLIKRIANFD